MSEAERKPYEDIKQEKVKELNDWKKKVENTARYQEIIDYGAVLYVLLKKKSSSITHLVLMQINYLQKGRYSAVICEV